MAIYGCIDKCIGCRHWNGTEQDAICSMYMRPYAKWGKLGGCEGATHVQRHAEVVQKARVGQQKQKKGGKK